MKQSKQDSQSHTSDIYTVFKSYLSVVRKEFRQPQAMDALDSLAYRTALEYARQNHLADGEIVLYAMQLQAKRKSQECVDLLSAHLAQIHPLLSSYAWNVYSVALWDLRRFDESTVAYRKAKDDSDSVIPPSATAAPAEEAITEYHKALDTTEDAPGHHWFRVGCSLSDQRKNEEAVIAYRKALEDVNYATPGRIWNNLGNALADLGRTEDAVAAYRNAVADTRYATPQHAWTNLGNLYSHQGNYDQAIATYRQALETPGDMPLGRVWFNMGLTLSAKESYADALVAYHKALEDNSFATPSYAWFNIGATLAEQGEITEAIAAYHRAIDSPNYDTPGFSWNNIANLLFEREEHSEAITAYHKALEDPQFDATGATWVNIGYSLSEQGRHAEAIDAYRKALSFPDYEARGDAWNNLGYAYSKQGRHAEAIDAYHHALEEPGYDTRGYTWNNLGLALSKQGKFDEVIDAYEKALAEPNYDAPGDAWFNIGSEYYRSGDIAKAREAFDKALHFYHPDSQEYNDARYWSETVQALKKPESLNNKDRARLDKPKKPDTGTPDIEWRIRSEMETAEHNSYEDYLQRTSSGRDNVVSVLRGWSNAVHLGAGSESLWHGGGYLIKWRGKGIVIDPGFEFLRNLHHAGYHGREIDAVLVSHNHPDHNADLKNVDDLRYELYKRRHSDEHGAVVPYVLIWDADSQSHIKLATQTPEHMHHPLVFDFAQGRCRPEDTIVTPHDLPFSVTYFGVHHDAQFEAVGFKVRLHGEDGVDFVIGYTGDTEFFPELAERLRGCDMLIAHINQPDITEFDDPKARKKGHLGYRGLAELVKRAQPKLTLVGDFWAGLVDLRIDLVHGMRRIAGTHNILPIGYGVHIDLPNMTIPCTSCGTDISYTDVRVAPPVQPFGDLAYLCPECILP